MLQSDATGVKLAAVGQERAAPTSATGEWRRVARELTSNGSAIVGAICLIVLVIAAVAAPLIAPFPPDKQDLLGALQAPSSTHLMGTDEFGRDVFSRILFGASISLRMGLLAVALAAVVGVTIGLCAGYFGAFFDTVSMRLVDTMLAFPDILLALVVLTVLGPSITSVTIAVAIAQIPVFIRLARASALSERERDYIVAIQVLGANNRHILFRHLLPNIVAPLVVLASVSTGSAILVGAGLSFLGLGARPPTPEWGAMLISSRLYIQDAPWMALFPGGAII